MIEQHLQQQANFEKEERHRKIREDFHRENLDFAYSEENTIDNETFKQIKRKLHKLSRATDPRYSGNI